jgi:hypothetical protein
VSNAGKIATLPVPARKRAANRVRRLRGDRSREAFVALLRARGVDVSERTLGDIERGRVRMTALEIVEALESQKVLEHRIGKSAEVPAGCEKQRDSIAPCDSRKDGVELGPLRQPVLGVDGQDATSWSSAIGVGCHVPGNVSGLSRRVSSMPAGEDENERGSSPRNAASKRAA